MRRANAGDAEAYSKLLQEIGAAMEGYIRHRFGHGDFVEDCVQECLLAIHRARESYDPRRRFRPWMFAIVRHKAIDMLRRGGTRLRHEAPEAEGAEQAAPAVEPSAALQTAEVLNALEPAYRDALILTRLRGHSLAEAAREVGVSPTAMKSRVHRALRQVQRMLEREED
jgi:RNA polymerase sigma-70 factor (ECF subfamily)